MLISPYNLGMNALNPLNSICLFCGASPGANPIYREAARQFGTILAETHIRLIYGGGSVGLMGVAADA